MARGVTAALSTGVAVFGFDPEAGTPSSRALHVVTLRRSLPKAELEARDRFSDAALRAVEEAGLSLGARRGGRGAQRLHLVSLADGPGRGRSGTAWYYATAPFGKFGGPGVWSPVGRGLRLDATDSEALRLALDR